MSGAPTIEHVVCHVCRRTAIKRFDGRIARHNLAWRHYPSGDTCAVGDAEGFERLSRKMDAEGGTLRSIPCTGTGAEIDKSIQPREMDSNGGGQ